MTEPNFREMVYCVIKLSSTFSEQIGYSLECATAMLVYNFSGLSLTARNKGDLCLSLILCYDMNFVRLYKKTFKFTHKN